MKTIPLAAAALLGLPLVAGAQTATGVTPPDQPRSNLEQQQTRQNGQATKYGQPGSMNQGASTSSTAEDPAADTSKSTMSQKKKSAKGVDYNSGKSGMSNPTNTVDPTTTK